MLFKDDDDYLKKYYDLDHDGEIDDFERKIAEDEVYYNCIQPYNKIGSSNTPDYSYNYDNKPVKNKTKDNKKTIITVVCIGIIIAGVLAACLIYCQSKYEAAVSYAIAGDYDNAELELCVLIDELKFDQPSKDRDQNLWFFVVPQKITIIAIMMKRFQVLNMLTGTCCRQSFRRTMIK